MCYVGIEYRVIIQVAPAAGFVWQSTHAFGDIGQSNDVFWEMILG